VEFWEDYEILRVETPEGLDLYLPLAGFGPRCLAFFLDMLIVGFVQVVLVVTLVFASIGAFANPAAGSATGAIVTFLVIILVVTLLLPVLYFAYFEWRWNGQSPGKRVAGIRVIRRGGFPVGAREILWRNVLRIIDYLPTNWMIGLISFFASQNQQRVGDIVADTVVVREFTQQAPFAWIAAAGSTGNTARGQGVLTPGLSYVIGSYLQRASELNEEARANITRRCIAALGYDAGHLTLPERERYLASVLQGAWAGQQ
jgi:uncharacterized RDD family membrane protein YckC